jgi:hypothetical protein
LEITSALDCPEADAAPEPEPDNVETIRLFDCPRARAVPVADPS